MTNTLRTRPRLTWVLPALLLLGACAPTKPGLKLDTSITAVGQSSRVKQLVLHYTVAENDKSLQILSQEQVSAHYLISDENPPHIYRLVDENRQAWHAGKSSWYDQPSINATSIGIEIVNPGWVDGNEPGTLFWTAFAPAQIESLVVLLNELVLRHGVSPQNIIGHSDIAPQRKVDPGPLFPWRQLSQHGLGRWYDEAGAAKQWVRLQIEGVPDTAWFQQQLQRLGYDCPQTGDLDEATIKVIAAFQMHYRPARHDGQPDAETAAIMLSMH